MQDDRSAADERACVARLFSLFQGDFCRETDHLACLLVPHRRREGSKAISVEKQTTWLVFSSRIDVAKVNENPAPVGLFLSGNRLNSSFWEARVFAHFPRRKNYRGKARSKGFVAHTTGTTS
jgi:hypothetical protein